MLRARRLASAVVAASLALGALSACRSEPTVAAYIGADGRVTEQRVQEVWDEVHDQLSTAAEQQAAAAEDAQRQQEKELGDAGQPVTPAPTITPEPVRMPISRADVVRALVGQRVYEEMAEERRITIPAGVSLDEVAAQLQLPAGTEFARLTAEIAVYRQLLGEAIPAPAQPTDDDLRTVYDRLAAGGGIPAGQDFAGWRAEVSDANLEAVAQAGAIRAEVEKTAEEMNIDVNPRYHPLEFDLLSTESESGLLNLLGAEIGEDLSAPVVDAS